MKHFKKRTLALVLASVVSIAGSFAANYYTNSLKWLVFNQTPSGVKVEIQTNKPIKENIVPLKKDDLTYVITLPETVSEISEQPKIKHLSKKLHSLEIRTMPYTNTSKGYTKITIKMFDPLPLEVGQKVFVPAKKTARLEDSSDAETRRIQREREAKVQELLRQEAQQRALAEKQAQEQLILEKQRKFQEAEERRRQHLEPEPVANFDAEINDQNLNNQEINNNLSNEDFPIQENSSEKFLLILGGLLVLGCIAYLYVRAKDKLREIAGENVVIDLNDENTHQPSGSKIKTSAKAKNLKQIKSTIRNLDAKLPKTMVQMPKTSEYTVETQPVPEKTVVEEVNVVDLDELYKEQKITTKETSFETEIEEEENAALEDFLSGFSFDEEFGILPEEPEQEPDLGYDAEFYDKIITNKNYNFTKDDIDKINKLLNNEISDSTLNNIEKYAVSNPIEKPISKQKVLEDLAAEYAISQNIIFSKDDMGALYKLINVEIDNDFISDLRTNPQRVEEMKEELLANKDKPRKPSEILTLNVKDVLPDLSEALRKQGGREIKSEVKPTTVYFSEGYEVSKLLINDKLPDLKEAMNREESYISKPSAEIELVDNSYNVEVLDLDDNMPDLADMLANPEKYESPKKEEFIPNEDDLLNNIVNVEFKPFYDGSQKFEIINDLEEETKENETNVSDIQKEFSQFENFEITEEEQISAISKEQEQYDDFTALYNNEFYDLDKVEEIETIEQEANSEIEQISLNSEIKKEITVSPENKITESQKTLQLKPSLQNNPSNTPKSHARIATTPRAIQAATAKTEGKISNIRCIFDGESYNVVSTAAFVDKMGCYLAKNENGYIILGYVGDKLFKIKQYSILKSEKIQTRLSEKLNNGNLRYLVRIGIHKFVVDIEGNDIKFVMDLC